MTCPKCNFQSQEEVNICESCKISLSRKKNWWKIGFFIELILFILLFGLVMNNYSRKNINNVFSIKEKTIDVQPSPKVQEETKTYIHSKIESYTKYSNPNLRLSFEYPSNWVLQDNSTESYGSPFVRVNSVDNDCEEEPQTTWAKRCHYYSLFIEEYDNSVITTENPEVYILQNLLEEAKITEKYCKEGMGCIGPSPGFPSLSGTTFWDFPKDNIFSAVGIKTMPRSWGWENNQYLVIKNKKVYLFELSAPDYISKENKPDMYDSQHPLMKILRSLSYQ